MFALRNRAAVLVLSVSILCALAPSPVSAQGKVKLPAIDVFGGYSYLRYESKTLGFADQMAGEVRQRSLRADDRLEGLARRLARRTPRPAPAPLPEELPGT